MSDLNVRFKEYGAEQCTDRVKDCDEGLVIYQYLNGYAEAISDMHWRIDYQSDRLTIRGGNSELNRRQND